MRTHVTQQVLTKCLKSLESKDLVQSVMSVKFPNRKMYLLKHLRPSEDIAGGPWQSEGDFDTALIETISGIVAQLFQANPSATPAQVEAAIESTAYKYTDGAPYEAGTNGSTSFDKGHGLVDVVAAANAIR